MKAARDLGIESKVHIVSDEIRPVVSVIVGTHAVQGPIETKWFMDESLTYVKQILSDMHKMACNN
jgi:hypothetical protein